MTSSNKHTQTRVTHTMQADSYKEHSVHQYDAHRGCQHLLEDLGCADGANSMRTLKWAVHTLHQQLQSSQSIPLHVTLEEHPASDQEVLQSTLETQRDWFCSKNVTHSILMKSFYEPLFPPNSVDLLMSYISLHWLDSSDTKTGTVSEWKTTTIVGTKSGDTTANANMVPPPSSNTSFTFMNEAAAPHSLQLYWRDQLAKVHLARFFALRARELRPGAEGILMMVGQPNDYVCPSHKTKSSSSKDTYTGGGGDTTASSSNSHQQASALTLAMQSCAKDGRLREEVLQTTILPYYCRTVEDIREAFDMASSIYLPALVVSNDNTHTNTDVEEEESYPGSFLTLVDVQAYPVQIGGTIQEAFDMFWSIHKGGVVGAGATEAELEHVRVETRLQFDELYSYDDDDEGTSTGISITYVACVIRRRTRKAWTTS